jgi:UvrD-like helicase C-terminal domain
MSFNANRRRIVLIVLLASAYAATIHKSQGSEYTAVVLPVMTQHYAMLNLLFTGVMRGQKLMVLRASATGSTGCSAAPSHLARTPHSGAPKAGLDGSARPSEHRRTSRD